MAKSRAWVMVEPGKVVMEEFEIPKIPEDHALLKVEACGICGTDKHVYAGHAPTAPFPFITGHEFIGTIVELGSKANDRMAVFGDPLKVGDRVSIAPSSLPCGHCHYCIHMPHRPALCSGRSVYGFTSTKTPPSIWGGYSEYVYLHPRSYVFQLPKKMPMKRAILTEPIATGLRAVERAYSPGEAFMSHGYGVGRSAMVLGAGPIGLMVIASLRYSGAGLIIAQDPLPSKLDMAQQMGADLLIDGKLPLGERLQRVREATDGVGPDIVLEAAGAPPAFQEALDFVRRGGKLIEVGHFTDTGSIDIHPFYICQKDLDIHGSWAYPALIFKDAISMEQKTALPLEKTVTHVLPLEEFPKGLELVGVEGVGKVVIAPKG
jgi:threonine dehydrogenase-like Zn-dependent dehydrogenase